MDRFPKGDAFISFVRLWQMQHDYICAKPVRHMNAILDQFQPGQADIFVCGVVVITLASRSMQIVDSKLVRSQPASDLVDLIVRIDIVRTKVMAPMNL